MITEYCGLNRLIGVRFDKCGCINYFYTGKETPAVGDKVIAESEMGLDMGEVIRDDVDESSVKTQNPVTSILRVANEDDLEKVKENEKLAEEAACIFREKTAFHGLEMKLIRVRYLFDRRKILFYYYADDRVDFRALVRDLASVFHVRIELRQIGVRDVARIVGGMGVCGRPACCATHMSGKCNANIRMAKEQGIALNPAGLTGACGRLMCCLEYESAAYEDLRKGMPSNGDLVAQKTDLKKVGRVVGANVLLRKCKVLFEGDEGEKEIAYLSAEELEIVNKRIDNDRESGKRQNNGAEEKALRELTRE